MEHLHAPNGSGISGGVPTHQASFCRQVSARCIYHPKTRHGPCRRKLQRAGLEELIHTRLSACQGVYISQRKMPDEWEHHRASLNQLTHAIFPVALKLWDGGVDIVQACVWEPAQACMIMDTCEGMEMCTGMCMDICVHTCTGMRMGHMYRHAHGHLYRLDSKSSA